MKGHVLPVLQLILLPVCCTATYLWSVLLRHVEAGFPYISDTGTYPPESCLFGLLLALYSFVTAGSVYLRWQQVRTFCDAQRSRGLRRVNNVSLVFGLLAAIGVLLVANFQETNVIVVHLVGAFMAFALGGTYTWFQTVISYKMSPLPGHKAWVSHFRLALSVIITVCCVMVVVFAQLASAKASWSSHGEGWKEHVTSTAFEWVLAFLSTVYFASFIREFKQFTFAIPLEFKVMQVKDDSQEENGDAVQPAPCELSVVS